MSPDASSRLGSGEISDTESLGFHPEEARPTFLSIARIAKDLAGASFGAVGLRHGGRWWIASVGKAAPPPLTGAPVSRALAHGPLWIEDSHAAGSATALLLHRAGLQFFASTPIQLARGRWVGAVMAGDAEPRPHCTSIADRLGDLSSLVADECERRRAVKALEEHEAEARALNQRMTSMIQDSPVALVMTDREFRVIQVSARWLMETGLVERCVLGRRIYDIFPRLKAEYDHYYQSALAGETLRTDRARLITPDGSTRWLRAETKPWRAPDGEIGGLLIMSYDVTDMVEALDAAEAGNRAKSEFLANMSHEIRTPLNGVRGPAGALAKTPLTPPQKEMVTLIENSARVLEMLLGDLLDLARAQSGQLELRDDIFDLWESIEAAASVYRRAAEEKSLAFDVTVPTGIAGEVRGDQGALRQILGSLLSNAVKFTAEGSVRVEATASAGADRLSLTLVVADTGVGFDEAQADRLFQRFETTAL